MTASPRWRGRRALVVTAAALASQVALASGISIPQGASINTGAGTSIRIGCGDMVVAGSLTAGAGRLALTGAFDVTGGTFNAGESTVSMGPAGEGCTSATTGSIAGAPVFYNWQVEQEAEYTESGYSVQLPVGAEIDTPVVTVQNKLILKNINLRPGQTPAAASLKAVDALQPGLATLLLKEDGTEEISEIGVDGVQSQNRLLASGKTNRSKDGKAVNFFALAAVDPDPGDPDPGDTPGGNPGGGSTLAKATPVPTLGLGGLAVLIVAVGAAAASLRRRIAHL